MKFKNIFRFAAVASAVLLSASCDNIAEADRYIPVTPVKVSRSVLVEEFSGQFCVNCPDGAEQLEQIQTAQGGADTVIVVSIHAGIQQRLALGVGQLPDVEGLATEFGETLFNGYGINSEPCAVVDRISGVVTQTKWLTSIVSALRRETSVALSAASEYNPADHKLTVSVTASSPVDFSGNINVWLTEDSIVTVQKLKTGGYDYNHVFNHIFRTSLTPVAGTPVSVSHGEGEKNVFTATVELDAIWRAKNMTVVAFVTDAAGVCQATRSKVEPR